ncbi:hypothetical protein MSMTP_2195 [Methanosarcina sp. MTP4]|uniref:NosD domain-containing protein n=1 Tax=Methanosarcina sp. MTP4 TaxID=1434100 RepID=UPI000615F0D2|nr:NosD domain-containing protein [Methanosarcina sp. MTP4]AKB25664.1 hypothetical protein MSMTP_2195 [Methanosarcina sp. MTP4]
MAKNKISILIPFMLLLILLVGASTAVAPAMAGDKYVDGEGIGGNYSSIQEAVSVSLPGDTIYVYPGEYWENVVVDVADLRILSVSGNPEDTIIFPDDTMEHVFDVSANNVTISGFSLLNPDIYTYSLSFENAGIYLTSSENTISNNIISGTSYGIYLDCSDNNDINDNTIASNQKYGVFVNCSDYNSFLNNEMSLNEWGGIYIEDSDYAEFTNNNVTGIPELYWATVESSFEESSGSLEEYSSEDPEKPHDREMAKEVYGVDYESSEGCSYGDQYHGIYMLNCNHSTLDSNDVTLSGKTGIYARGYDNSFDGNNVSNNCWSGIHIEGGENDLYDNIVNDNEYCGIRLGKIDWDNYTAIASNNNELVNNNVSLNGYCGIRIDGDYNELRENDVIDNNYCGIRIGSKTSSIEGYIIFESNHSTLVNNDVSYNGESGIRIDGSSNTLTDNDVIGNDGSGIRMGNAYYDCLSSDNIISGNNASFNYCCGIYMEGENNSISDNTVIENDDEGINLEYSNNNTITGNNASLNYKGIRLDESQFNIVSNNIVNANDYPGIVLCYADNNTVSSNTVLDGDAKGINVYESDHNTLIGNTVNNSGAMGLHLYYSSYNTVVDNVITYSECVGLKVEDGCYNTLTGNTVSFNDGAGIVIYDDDSHNTTIENNVVNNNGCNGIRVKGSDNYVAGNTVCNNEDWGIFVGTCDVSSNNTVIENTVRNNLMGIVFRSLYDSEVASNTVTDNGIIGICLSESENLILQSNIVNSNGYLVEEEEEEYYGAASVVNSDEKKECSKRSEEPDIVMASELVLGEGMGPFGAGIYLEFSSENCLIGNSVENNSDTGLYFIGSWNNTIYDNYFNNTNNTKFEDGLLFTEIPVEEEGNNTWNINLTEGTNIMGGPYLGGNFWALPNGTGWSQTCNDTDGDWICDLPYNVTEDGESVDYFPLIDFPEPEPEPEPAPVKRSSSSGSPTYIPPPAGENAGPVDSAQKKVVAGQESSVQFPNPENGVLGVGFKSKGYSGMVIVRVEGADEGDSGSNNKPNGKVYRHVKILVGNERFEENIDQGYIEFRVPKSWMEENNIDPATIGLNRYHDEAWNPLSTEMTGEDEEFYYFRAETPGFSLYAITGEAKSSGEVDGTEVITPNEEETGTETGEEQTKPGESESAPGFESIFAALGILGSAFLVRKEILK